jgi:hypothetical protein
MDGYQSVFRVVRIDEVGYVELEIIVPSDNQKVASYRFATNPETQRADSPFALFLRPDIFYADFYMTVYVFLPAVEINLKPPVNGNEDINSRRDLSHNMGQ